VGDEGSGDESVMGAPAVSILMLLYSFVLS